ncbi:hypothetical protein SISNIDRAFT_489839 [Sistotremastrum niveocremeum HHB9708]|uniref:Zn(2)-C6 fungal-type domain-containing protein n=1 Tax=Sistotremastrum niveocremeum HHB9708 TaxID=1314777 RepID=A0A164PK62_9AGAM|nr:hypothetical protein SISNIDRAFT_489839 [Sistotremastrum niveocremeum HHB9708]
MPGVPEELHANTLFRGAACLSCRRKKLRCSGDKPFCTRCKRLGQEDECQYDGEHKSTQKEFLDKIAVLESRIKELEESQAESSQMALQSGDAQPSRNSPVGFFNHRFQLCPLLTSPEAFENPCDTLFEFMSLYHRYFTFLPMSAPPSMSQAIPKSSNPLHLIMSSYLSALFYFTQGKLRPADYHANATLSLALQWRLHSIDRPSPRPQFHVLPELRGPSSAFEISNHRTLASSVFWQVFCMNACWSVVISQELRVPSTVPQHCIIMTSLPDLESHEPSTERTLDAFFRDPEKSPCPGIETLLIKAAATFSRAAIFSQLSLDAASYLKEYLTIYNAIGHLISVTSLPSPTTELGDLRLFLVHALLRTASILLYNLGSSADPNLRMQSLEAARQMRESIKLIGNDRYPFLDPMLSFCWMQAGYIFLRERAAIAMTRPTPDVDEQIAHLTSDLQGVTGALQQLARVFPIAVLMLQRLNSLEQPFMTS